MMKWLTSMKTALAIMLLLIVSSILATFFPNFNIYQTFWYRGLLLFLSINMLFCTGKNLPIVFKNLTTTPEPGTNKFNAGKNHKLKNQQFEKNIVDLLNVQKYSVKTNHFKKFTVISAHKGLMNYLAPHILHISLIIVFVGALIYSFGSSDNIQCYVGETAKLPKEIMPTVTMRVDNFETLYDQSGSIDNWQSEVTLLKDGKQLLSRSLKVNQPLEYDDVKFYQSGYGYDHQIEVTGEHTGQYSLPTDESVKLADRNFRIVLENKKFVMKISDGFVEQSVPLKEGQTIEFPNNTTVKYQKLKPYTILSVKRAPGGPIIMFGLIIMSASSLLFWSNSYRKINIFINHQDNLVQFSVFCKHKEIRDDLNNQIMQSL